MDRYARAPGSDPGIHRVCKSYPEKEPGEGDVRKRIKTGNAKEKSFSPFPRVHKEQKKHEHKRAEPS